METTILAKVYESANSSLNFDETTKNMLHDVKCEMHTLSGAIKAIKAQSKEAKSAIDYVLASYDLDLKTLSPKTFMAKIPKELYNQDGKVCKVRRNYEYEDVQIYRSVEGKPMPVCKDGKPVTRKMPKLDGDGKKIVKDYTLCEIKKWDVDTIFEVLRQVDAIAICK